MRNVGFYAVLCGFGFLGSLQGCDCKSDDTKDAPDAAVDGGTIAPEPPDGATTTCLDQDPPSGFSAVSSGDGKLGTYGEHVAMTLDDKGSPLVAFVHQKPDGTSASDQASILYFTRWDRCTATWTAPVNVDVVGAISDGSPEREVAIARDPSTGAIGLAFAHVNTVDPGDEFPEVWFASSTDQGATWTKAVVSQVPAGKEGGTHTAGGPSLAMGGGKIYLGYWQENTGCAASGDEVCNGWYVEGTPAAWTRAVLPNLSGGFGASLITPVSVALDSAGKPAVAYIVAPNTGYNAQIAFWRPGTPTAVKVTDSKNIQNDAPVVTMVFEGTKPRIATLLGMTESDFQIHFLRSNDGATWDAPIALPNDHTDVSAFYESLAAGPNGSFAVVSRVNGGSGDAVCGAPKISRSTDDGATWTTCGADTTKTLNGVGGPYVSAAFLPSGKLAVAFEVTPNESDPIKSGVAIWREP